MVRLWQGLPDGAEEKAAEKYHSDERGVCQGGIP
jgi:hypothetical protein